MKTALLALRILTGLMLAGGLLILLLIVLLRSAGALAKEGVGVLAYVVELFTSGFTRGTRPGEPSGWAVSWPQWGLAALFLAQFFSLFLPGAKPFLHGLALTTGVALIASAWWMRAGLKLEIFCLPLLAVWFGYYALCLWGRRGALGG
jgi:hypothetical protein